MTAFTLARQAQTDCSTWGVMSDEDGIEICRWLERGPSNPDGHPRIPAGSYEIERKPFGASKFDHVYLDLIGARYHGILWLPSVPGRQNIEFHTANFETQLLGCLAAATSIVTGPDGNFDAVESKVAYTKAYPLISAAVDAGGAQLTITDPPGA